MTRMLRATTRPVTPDEVAGAVTWMWGQYLRTVAVTVDSAVGGQDRVRFTHVQATLRRVDELLDLWLEADREQRGMHLGCWWVQSWPGSLPPTWPDEAP